MRFEREILLKTGERCLLRSAGAADAAEVLDSFIKVHGETDYLLSYPDENTHTVEGEEKFLAAAEESDRNAFIIAVIDGKVVGDAGIDPVGNREKNRHRADFGISVLKEHWGKGIGTEACKAVIDFGFQVLDLHKIYARHFVSNPASGRVMQKSGMEYEGTQKSHDYKDGRYEDVASYGILHP